MAAAANFNPMRHRIPILKRLVPSLKRRWWRIRHPGGTGIVSSHGVRFLLDPQNFVDRQVAFYDDFEGPQLEYLSSAIAASACTVFLDVGAAFGYYSIILATRFPDLSVVAFEPDPRNLEQLRANLALNDLQGRVSIQAAAASARSGAIGFRPGPATSTGQSMVDFAGGALTVPAVAIDDVVGARGTAIAAKIDVEEHELEVLKGMERTLGANRCVLQIETFRDHVAHVRDHLAARDYRLCHSIEHDHYFVNFATGTEPRARTAP